jgi:hypothetical protein
MKKYTKPEFKLNESLLAAEINKFLRPFGNNQINPREPMFRLVWSEFQRELRTGEYDVHYGPLFIRKEVATKEVPKYPFLKERYILEQWYPPDIAYTKELPNSAQGSYEPIYVFESGKGDRLPLNKRVVEIIMHGVFNTSETEKDRACRMKAAEDLKELKEQEYFEDALECSSDIMSNLHFGEGIIVPSNYDVVSPNLKNKGTLDA